MPTGFYRRRRAERQFRPEMNKKHGFLACEWLENIAQQERIQIDHAMNSAE